jgi:hypothetical protein
MTVPKPESYKLLQKNGKRRLELLPEEEGDHSIEEAVEVFKRHHVQGLTNRESVRRAIKTGRLPHKRIKAKAAPYRISLKTIESILTKHAQQTKTDDENGSHRKLIDHFTASSLHNPVSAVSAGIVKSIHEAVIVYRIFKRHQSEMLAIENTKKYAEWETKQIELSKEEVPCERCSRVYFNARRESARVVSEVTGRPVDPWLHTGTQFEEHETNLLTEYRENWFCSLCLMWNVAAPVDEMKAALTKQVPLRTQTG